MGQHPWPSEGTNMTNPSDPPNQPPPPAAWYQDRSDPALLRYWDGTRWTAQTAARSTETDQEVLAQPDPCGGAVSTQPVGDSPVSIERLAPHKGWYPDPLGQHFARWWDGDAWTTRLTNRDGFAYKEPPPLKTQGPLGGREVIADYPMVGPPAAAKQIGIIIRNPPVRSSATPARSDSEKSTGLILLAIILALVVLGALVGATSSADSTTGGSDSNEYDYDPGERGMCERNYDQRDAYAENDRETFIRNCMSADEDWDINGDGDIG